MEISDIKFAFAVANNNTFEKKHFGDADKYMIFTLKNKTLTFDNEEVNQFRNFDETKQHGSIKKGEAIISFLKEKGVDVLVSMQFGKNIKMVNSFFIPVIIKTTEIEHAKNVLAKHIKWLADELNLKPQNHKLFVIDNGIMKQKID